MQRNRHTHTLSLAHTHTHFPTVYLTSIAVNCWELVRISGVNGDENSTFHAVHRMGSQSVWVSFCLSGTVISGEIPPIPQPPSPTPSPQPPQSGWALNSLSLHSLTPLITHCSRCLSLSLCLMLALFHALPSHELSYSLFHFPNLNSMSVIGITDNDISIGNSMQQIELG